jgi:hypothetical protein
VGVGSCDMPSMKNDCRVAHKTQYLCKQTSQQSGSFVTTGVLLGPAAMGLAS